ncbi:FkbM family methyltransferase [Streptomyces aidingensis]|uniref:Methyltransferase, FkbM family n=1 Tax=Streptomyces aidingensis TaxID=910347 RepID=A0A1I1HFF3_9ACTN|nr:FkbM family methyltransferase [Streptomyces aidingensis]SFC22737.1 methyltransferase, FkbM family [Streptomyces aidingensis]
MRLADLEAANTRMLAHAPVVRPVSTSDIIKIHRKKFPYKGWVEIDSPHCAPFVVFCGNDEAVALDTLWNGEFRYEPGTLATWAGLAAGSRTVVDVGAHVGYFSLIAALAAPEATVHSFEPVDYIHARLAVNQRANNIQNLVRHQAGVSDREGRAEITVRFSANLLSTGASLDRLTDTPGSRSVQPIRLVTLDGMFPEGPVDLIKIDVEGHEPRVIAGARELIRRDRPVILMEALRDAAMEELLADLGGLGYAGHWLREKDGSLVPYAEGRPAGSRNLLFRPGGGRGRQRA